MWCRSSVLGLRKIAAISVDIVRFFEGEGWRDAPQMRCSTYKFKVDGPLVLHPVITCLMAI